MESPLNSPVSAMLQRYAPYIRTCAHRKNCSFHDAEDIVQDVALRVVEFQAKKGFPPPEHYVKKFTRWKIAESYGRRSRSPLWRAGQLGDEVSKDNRSDPEANAFYRESISRFLTSLPVEIRGIVERRYLLDEAVKDIAATQKATPNAIHMKLKRAKQFLRGLD